MRDDRNACLYTSKKGYEYWARTDQHQLLRPDALPERGCPFGDARWQLWVNLALAHEEGARRNATDVRFAVCASSQNDALLQDGMVLSDFRALLRAPESVTLLDLDALLAHLGRSVPPELENWASELSTRYAITP